MKKFYNYCSQSAAHQFSFKHYFKKLVAIAEASFSMQVVWIDLSRRRLHNISYLTYWNSLPNFVMSASSLNSSELDYWIIPVHSFVLLSGNEIYLDFTFCSLFSCFSCFFLIQRIVIYISLREQFLYWNSVSPILLSFTYCTFIYNKVRM